MIIGERSLELRLDEGTTIVPVRIFAPVYNKPGWACRYTIGWPHAEWDSEGSGHDAIQAIWMTLQKIGTEIYASPYHQSGQLAWEQAGSGYGFPVPKNARSMLIGEDLRFDG